MIWYCCVLHVRVQSVARYGVGCSSLRRKPSSEILEPYRLRVRAPQVEMEKHWLQYDEEEDVISIAVADAILDDLLFDITSELVLL